MVRRKQHSYTDPQQQLSARSRAKEMHTPACFRYRYLSHLFMKFTHLSKCVPNSKPKTHSVLDKPHLDMDSQQTQG